MKFIVLQYSWDTLRIHRRETYAWAGFRLYVTKFNLYEKLREQMIYVFNFVIFR